MNIIADRLFALLLGWTGSLFNGLWNLITNEGGAFAGFLRSFWLPMILILLLFGTVVDYVIWLIRWRPYYVWSSWLRRVIGRRRLHQTRSYMEDLDHSPLDLPEYQELQGEGQSALYDEPIYFDFQAAPYAAQQEYPEYPEDAGIQPLPLQEEPYQEQFYQEAQPQEDHLAQELPPAFVPSLPWENLRPVPIATFPMAEELPPSEVFQEEPPALQEDTGPAPAFDEEPYHPDDLYLAETQQQEAAPDLPPTLRRRRVDNRRRRAGNMLKSIRDTLFDAETDPEAGDIMQPPVSPEAAFHKPYYPQSYQYREQKGPPPGQEPPQP